MDTEADTKEAAEKDIAKELRLKGIVLADAEVVEAMDYDEPGFSFEKVFKQDGTLTAAANALDAEQMAALMRHTRRTAEQFAQEIREGRMDVSPVQVGEETPCTYCTYAGICRRDPRLPGGQPRKSLRSARRIFLPSWRMNPQAICPCRQRGRRILMMKRENHHEDCIIRQNGI